MQCLSITISIHYIIFIWHTHVSLNILFFWRSKTNKNIIYFSQRSNRAECTRSRPITKVKQRRARIVLGWVTAWELRVVLAFFYFPIYFIFLNNQLLTIYNLSIEKKMFCYNTTITSHYINLIFAHTYVSLNILFLWPSNTNKNITYFSQRSNRAECTRSRPITKVKQRWARIVLGWVTAWELRVVLAFFYFSNLYYFS